MFSKITRTFGPLGAYQVVRQIFRSQPRILMNHRFSSSPAENEFSSKHFAAQAKHIKRNYTPFSLIGLIAYHQQHGCFLPHAVVIMVDDVYRYFYEHAFLIPSKSGVPTTLFGIKGFIECEYRLWPDKITWLLIEVSEVPETTQIDWIELLAGPVTGQNRTVYWKRLNDRGLSLPDQEKRGLIGELTICLNKAFPTSIPVA